MARGGAARADEDPAGEAARGEAERLLVQLASDDFAVREASRKRLAALARPARSVLEAHRADADPEVRRTVLALLAGLGGAEEPAAPTGELGSLGRVSLAATGTLAEALARFETAASGHVRVPASASGVPVELSIVDRPYFDALDAILEAAGLELGDGFDEAGQALATPRVRGETAPPSASEGPFRLEVESVSARRTLKGGQRPRSGVVVRALWSPAVQVISFQQPAVVRALDPAGKSFRSGDAGPPTYYGVGGGQRQTSFTLSLDPVDAQEPERLALLELVVPFRVRHGRQAASFHDFTPEHLPETQKVPLLAGGGSGTTDVTLEAFGPDPERAGVSVGTVRVLLPRGVPADSLGATLEAADGSLRPMIESSTRMSGSDGVVKMTFRTIGAASAGPWKSLRISWTTKEEEIPVRFTLRDVPLR